MSRQIFGEIGGLRAGRLAPIRQEFSFDPPELVEPPSRPLTVDDMAQLPKPLPTEQPKVEDRAELPPPPGYENIPIMWGDVAAAPPPVPPNMIFSADPTAPPIQPPPIVVTGGAQPGSEASTLDHNDDAPHSNRPLVMGRKASLIHD